jgi:hypothetical protein
VINGPPPGVACFDIDSHFVGVDYPVEPYTKVGTSWSVPAGYTGVVTLMDRGAGGYNGVLSPGATYTEATGVLSVSGSSFATLPAQTLGAATRSTPNGAPIQNGFSVLLEVQAPATLPGSAVTVFSMGADAAGASGSTVRVTLQGPLYTLSYGTSGNSGLKTFNWLSTNGVTLASVTAGSIARLLVRCYPGLTLCVLGNY